MPATYLVLIKHLRKESVLGYSPVYKSEVKLEGWSRSQELNIPDQIYLIDFIGRGGFVGYSCALEVGDSTFNPQSSVLLAFSWPIQVAIKDDLLYTNQFSGHDHC